MRAGLPILCAVAALVLAGCATRQPPACPSGQQRLRTAELYFRTDPDGAPLSDRAFRSFVDKELTPRFPDGLTILDGGARWRGPENQMMREAAKVVLVVLPQKGDAGPRLDAVRAAYKARFRQETAMQVALPACMPF
jgi:hypothetical protein